MRNRKDLGAGICLRSVGAGIPCWRTNAQAGESWTGRGSETPSLEVGIRTISRKTAWLCSPDPVKQRKKRCDKASHRTLFMIQSSILMGKINFCPTLISKNILFRSKTYQMLFECCQQPTITHFPHSFRMPFWFFLCSGETGDCWPDSTPDDIGERSDKVESSVFSVFPVNRM